MDYATGTGPHRLVLQDLNGDGRLDIATANYDVDTVSVLYGNGTGAVGNGTFAAKVDFAVSGNPYSIAAGDLNGDGRVDLAVGAYGEKAVKVYKRQTDGTYLAGDVFAWGPSYGITALAIGDVEEFKAVFEKRKGNNMPAPEMLHDDLATLDSGDRKACADVFTINVKHLGMLVDRDGAQYLMTLEEWLGQRATALATTVRRASTPLSRAN